MGKIGPQIINTVRKFKGMVSAKYGIERIILFGSAARGEMKTGSDVDLLIVTKKKANGLTSKLLIEWHIRQGIRNPVDFITYTKREFEQDLKGVTLASIAVKEGVEII